MNYFMFSYFIILGIFSIRGIYATHKFLRYCKENYPEKASEFLSLGTITMAKALFTKHDVDDLQFVILKNRAKNAWATIIFAFFIGVFFILVLVGIPFIFSR